jgi:hypothetical protein
MEVDELDDATREVLMRATIHPEWGTRLRCVGTVAGAACEDQLYQCAKCRRTGCRTKTCSQYLYGPGNACVRCGEGAGMNRHVKLSAVRLMQLWEKLHLTSPK